MNKVTLDHNDLLLHYGYGLFETLKVTAQGVRYPHLHYHRLSEGGQILGIEIPVYKDWLSMLDCYTRQHLFPFPYALRVTVSGGEPGQGLSPQFFYQQRKIPYTKDHYQNGVAICILSQPRNEASILTQIKSVNYLENMLARREAQHAGAQEGIWVNTKNYLVEGTASNLFFSQDDVLYTPALDCGCLPGTRRSVVKEIAASFGIEVIEGEFSPQMLKEAGSVFLTNSLMGIMPVSHIQGVTWEPSDVTIMECLKREYNQREDD